MIKTLDLVSLTLCNFLGYKGVHTFTFEPGLTGIIGPNGVGKSTILQCIPEIIWGVFDTNLAGMLNNEVFPDPTGKEECYASLDFNAGPLHRITRSIDSRGKSMSHKLEIFSDEYPNNFYSKSQKDITKYILELTKINHDMAKCSIISLQGKTDYFFELENPKQKEMIDSYLQAQYEVRQERLNYRLKLFDDRSSRIDKFTHRLKTTLAEHTDARSSVNLTLNALNTTINTTDMRDLESKLQIARAKVSELESPISSIETFKKSILTSEEQIQSLQDKIASYETKVTSLANEKKAAEEASLKSANLLNTTKQVILTKRKVKKPSAKDLLGVKEQTKYYIALHNNYVTETTSAQRTIESLQDALAAIKESGSKINSSIKNGICHACGQSGVNKEHLEKELQAARAEYATKEQERKDYIKRFEEDMLKRQEFKVLKEEWENKLQEIELQQDAFTAMDKVRAKLASDLRKQYRDKRASDRKVNTLTTEHSTAVEQLPEKRREPSQRIKELQEEIKNLQDKVASTNVDQGSLDSYKTEVTTLEGLRDAVISAKAQVLIHEKQVVQLNGLIEKVSARIAAADKTYGVVSLRASEYKYMKKIFNSGYEKYFSRALKIISTETSKILKELQSPLSVDITCLSKGKGSTINTVVMRRGRPIVYQRASGGQRVVLGICFRMALWRFINASVRSPVSFFILDEVFGQLDPENSAYVFEQILKLKKYFKSVLITSHTDHVWSTDNKIMVS